MSSYWGLEDETGHRLLEDGTGGWLIETATTFAVSSQREFQYDINGIVSDTLEILYDITGVVSDTLEICYDINSPQVSSNLIQQYKNPLLPQLNTEFKLVEKTDGPWNYSCWVNLENMLSGDKVRIKVYRWDPNLSTYTLYESKTISKSDLKGKETDDQPAVFAVFLPTERFKLTIEQLSGTLRSFPWEMYKA